MHYAVLRLSPRGREHGTGSNVGPAAATIEGDVINLQQCCCVGSLARTTPHNVRGTA